LNDLSNLSGVNESPSQEQIIKVNTSGQINYRVGNANGRLIIWTKGWIDLRGKDS